MNKQILNFSPCVRVPISLALKILGCGSDRGNSDGPALGYRSPDSPTTRCAIHVRFVYRCETEVVYM